MRALTTNMDVPFSSPFPPDVAFAAVRSDDSQLNALLPEEQTLASSFRAEKRRADFVAGRQAARAGLQQLDLPNAGPILQGVQREPLWPDGSIGAIAHSGGWAVAAVGRTANYAGIGFDMEQERRSMTDRVAGRFCVLSEAEWVFEDGRLHRDRALMLFTAKEALYKALYPTCKVFFGFEDALLTWDETCGRFSVELLKTLCPELKKGHIFSVGCLRNNGFIYSWTAHNTCVLTGS